MCSDEDTQSINFEKENHRGDVPFLVYCIRVKSGYQYVYDQCYES